MPRFRRGGRAALGLFAGLSVASGCADLVGARFDKAYVEPGGGGAGGCALAPTLALQDALSRPLAVGDVDARACDDVALVGHGIRAPGPGAPASPLFVRVGPPGPGARAFECGVNLSAPPDGPVPAAGTAAALVRSGDEVYFGGAFRGVLRCPGAEKDFVAERSRAYLAKVDFSAGPALAWVASVGDSEASAGFGHAFHALAPSPSGGVYAAGHASGAVVFDPPGEGTLSSSLSPPALSALVVSLGPEGQPLGNALLGENDLVSSVFSLDVSPSGEVLALAGVYLGSLGDAAGPGGLRHDPAPGDASPGLRGFVAKLPASRLSSPSAPGAAPVRAEWAFGLGPAAPFPDPPEGRPGATPQAAFSDVVWLSDGHLVAAGSYRGRIADAEGKVELCAGVDPAAFGEAGEGERLKGILLFLDAEGHCVWLASLVSVLPEPSSVEVLRVAEASSGLVYASVLAGGPLEVALPGLPRRPLLEAPGFPLYTLVVEVDRVARALRPATVPFAVEGSWQGPAGFVRSPPRFPLSSGPFVAFAFATSADPDGRKLASTSAFLHFLEP